MHDILIYLKRMKCRFSAITCKEYVIAEKHIGNILLHSFLPENDNAMTDLKQLLQVYDGVLFAKRFINLSK